MRSTALASKDEYDEVPVSSNPDLERNVAAIRVDLDDLKTKFVAAVSKLEADIREMGAKAESNLKEFAASVASKFAELQQELRDMRADDKTLNAKIDATNEKLNAKIDATNEKLIAKIDATNDRIDLTNEKLSALDHKVTEIGVRLTALFWVAGGLGTFVTIIVTIDKMLHWFR